MYGTYPNLLCRARSSSHVFSNHFSFEKAPPFADKVRAEARYRAARLCLGAWCFDAAIVASGNPQQPWRIAPVIATNREELTKAMTTRHCLVPANMLLSEAVLRRVIRKLAVVGCPCHIEGIRKIQMAGAVPECQSQSRSVVFR